MLTAAGRMPLQAEKTIEQGTVLLMTTEAASTEKRVIELEEARVIHIAVM